MEEKCPYNQKVCNRYICEMWLREECDGFTEEKPKEKWWHPGHPDELIGESDRPMPEADF